MQNRFIIRSYWRELSLKLPIRIAHKLSDIVRRK